jgi:hypothetical protein
MPLLPWDGPRPPRVSWRHQLCWLHVTLITLKKGGSWSVAMVARGGLLIALHPLHTRGGPCWSLFQLSTNRPHRHRLHQWGTLPPQPCQNLAEETTRKLPMRSRPVPGGVGQTGSNPYYTAKASLRGERFPHFLSWSNPSPQPMWDNSNNLPRHTLMSP